MAFKFIDGLRLCLKKGVSSSDTSITVDNASVERLTHLGVGNYIYLTIRNGLVSEVVKYTAVLPLPLSSCGRGVVLTIERNANGLGAFNFPSCATVEADLNLLNLTEIHGSL